MIMRGTHESNVAEYPFRLVQICVYQESGKVLFKKPLWLMVAGERRIELSLQDIFYSYRQRFDLYPLPMKMRTMQTSAAENYH